jgi:hypothetical protein
MEKTRSNIAMLEQFISDQSAYMPLDTLKMAKIQLNKYKEKTPSTDIVIWALELATKTNNANTIDEAITLAKQYLQKNKWHPTVHNLLKEAERQIEKFNFAENSALIEELRIEDLEIEEQPKVLKTITTHPLLQRLREVISKMMNAAANNDLLTEDLTRHIIKKHNPIGQNVVRVLLDLINDATKVIL